MAAALSENRRHAHMAYAISKNFPRLKQEPIGGKSISIACYGPSLADTWQDITRPVISVSGAHDYLIERGIVPDFHVDMDPRKHKTAHISNPHKDVKYLMASVCHPWTWKMLEGHDVRMWHTISGKQTKEWLTKNDPGSTLIYGGSSVGLAALQVGGFIGYRHFEIHGMDGSFRGTERHAGKHYGLKQKLVEYQINGKSYTTTTIMMNSNFELINVLHAFPMFCVFHGEGLIQELVREDPDLPNAALSADAEKSEFVRRADYVELSEAPRKAA